MSEYERIPCGCLCLKCIATYEKQKKIHEIVKGIYLQDWNVKTDALYAIKQIKEICES